jgi:hypothetical protein
LFLTEKFLSKKLKYFKPFKAIITIPIMSQPVFNWASVAKGKPQTTAAHEAEQAAIKEKKRLAKAERDAPIRAQAEAMRLEKKQKEEKYTLAWQQHQEEHDRKFSKEGGWLPGQWPTSHQVPYEPHLTVPKHVNERARDWTERALASWWPVWEKCDTIETLRAAFLEAFVPYALEHGNYRGADDYDYWEKNMGLAKGKNEAKGTHAERYATMLQWVKQMETDKVNPPYWNTLWVACKNITFEHCLWAMNVEAQTFRAHDKLCPNIEIPITGFLQVEGQTITWLADFANYIPYRHDPKPKSKQAIESKRKRDEEEFERMLKNDYC